MIIYLPLIIWQFLRGEIVTQRILFTDGAGISNPLSEILLSCFSFIKLSNLQNSQYNGLILSEINK